MRWRRARGTASAESPAVSVADLQRWRAQGVMASVHVTPVPAPRAVAAVVAAAEREQSQGQFGYREAGAASDAVARFTFEDGRFIDIRGPGVIGRDPQTEPADDIVHFVRLDDPRRELSRVHLSFGIDEHGGLWVCDRYSTNGVAIQRGAAGLFDCAPGARTPIRSGDIVTFGGHAMAVTQLAGPSVTAAEAAAAVAP
ncbi:MAG: FHA domain-containing protein [Microbacteriaceae bacterium]